MLDYVFFDRRPCERFMDFVREQGLEPGLRQEQETWEVSLPEDLDEELSERIEDYYDEMMAFNQQLYDAEAGQDADNYHAAGVVVNLRDGRTVYANVEPLLLAKVMEVLTPEEFGRVINAVVDAVEDPDERTFCQRMRDGD